MAYCTADDVRVLTNLSASDIPDANLNTLITYATAQLNRDIQTIYEDEKVEYISAEKENDIDGSNTTFYVKHPWIGDYNNDGQVTTADLYVYTIDSDGTRTVYTVSSIDDTRVGKFTLSSAPTSSEELYVTYASAPVDVETPDSLVKLACAQLAAALAFTRIDAGKAQSFRVGKIAVTKQTEGFTQFITEYRRTVNLIRSKVVKEAKYI